MGHAPIYTFSCVLTTCTHIQPQELAHQTPIFNVPVSAKKGSHRRRMSRAFATLPPSLQCWWCGNMGAMLPAKKDSLSARAHLHRRLVNIEERGEGQEKP